MSEDAEMEHQAVARYLETGKGPRPSDAALARYREREDAVAWAEVQRLVAEGDRMVPDPETGELRSLREMVAEAEEAEKDMLAAARILEEVALADTAKPDGPRA